MTTDRIDFGARLRQAREARGISLAQIAASTKISAMSLEALERNDVSRLPGGLFSRGFVRAYAREVGLDPERTVEEFIERFGGDIDRGTCDDAGRSRRPDVEAAAPSPTSPLRWLGLIVTLVLIVAFFGVERYLSTRQAGREAAGPSAARTAPQPALRAEPPAAPSEAGSASQAQAPPAEPQPDVAEATTGAKLPLRIVLIPNAECWVSARVDGTRVAGRTLKPGERLELAAGEQVVLTAGDAGALTYTLNEMPGRALGSAGQVVTTVINVQNYQTFIRQ